MQRRELEYPTDFPLFSGMDEHGPQDEYATFLAQAVTYDTDELLEAVEALPTRTMSGAFCRFSSGLRSRCRKSEPFETNSYTRERAYILSPPH